MKNKCINIINFFKNDWDIILAAIIPHLIGFALGIPIGMLIIKYFYGK